MRSFLFLSLLTVSSSAFAHELSIEGAPRLSKPFISSQKFNVSTEFPTNVSIARQHCPHHATHSQHHHSLKQKVGKPLSFGNNLHNFLLSPQYNSVHSMHKHHKHQYDSKDYLKNQ